MRPVIILLTGFFGVMDDKKRNLMLRFYIKIFIYCDWKKEMRKFTHEEIIARQEGHRKTARLPFTVVLNNIRSAHNVGSIFRTADGVGVEKVWLCGITGYPPNAQISKTALGAEDRVAWDYSEDVLTLVRDLKAQGYQIVFLEQMDESVDYHSFIPQVPFCLILGNEIGGVTEKLVTLCDAAVEIAMMGVKNSLNVGVAFGIVAYQFRHSLLDPMPL